MATVLISLYLSLGEKRKRNTISDMKTSKLEVLLAVSWL